MRTLVIVLIALVLGLPTTAEQLQGGATKYESVIDANQFNGGQSIAPVPQMYLPTWNPIAGQSTRESTSIYINGPNLMYQGLRQSIPQQYRGPQPGWVGFQCSRISGPHPMVIEVFPDTSAWRNGLQVMDVLIAFDGMDISNWSLSKITKYCYSQPAGAPINVTYRHAGRQITQTFIRSVRPAEYMSYGDY